MITGSSGFIGRHVVAKASSEGHDVVTWTSDRGWFDQPIACATLAGVDAVIHLAGRFPERGGIALSALETFQANAMTTAILIDACEKLAIQRVVLASTALVYQPSKTPTQSERSPTPARGAYATSKLCAEMLVRAHGGVSLRLFNVYGPGQNPRNVFMTIARQALQGAPVRIMDDRPVRDFIHVEDVARALVAAAVRRIDLPNVINIGTGQGTSIRTLARLILAECEHDDSIRFENQSDNEGDSLIADIALARDVLAWTPLIDLSRGVSDTLRKLRTFTP